MYTVPLYDKTNEELAQYAVDPDCSNAKDARIELETRIGQDVPRRERVKADLEANPFDPRNEVSADARYIAKRVVKHLWIIFLVVPTILSIILLALR